MLVVQMQKYEDSAPDNLEFERLKEHFEPYLRNQLAASSTAHSGLGVSHSLNPVTASASSALSREIPGVSKFSRSRSGRVEKPTKEDFPEYRSRIEVGIGGFGLDQGDEDAEFMRLLEEINETAPVEQRWTSSWTPSLHSRLIVFRCESDGD
jgi:dynactin-4